MNHFNPKTLAFYGVAIGAVVLLFNRVSAYGEANLKAPARIEGFYQVRAENLPSCLKTTSPGLKIDQSGVYLKGSLSEEHDSAKAATSSEEKPSLTGQWQGGKFSLSGLVPHTACPSDTKIEITGSMSQSALSGQLSFNSGSPIQFTAQRQGVKP
jgi:hypothetical protein